MAICQAHKPSETHLESVTEKGDRSQARPKRRMIRVRKMGAGQGKPDWMKPPMAPRFLWGAYSMAKVWPTAYSPPKKMPMSNRNTQNMTYDQTPTWAYVGRNPPRRDITPTPPMVRIRRNRLPILSA